MYFGSAWYPEHWPASRWAEDLRLMRKAGMNVVRMGEFAWCRLEPEEGRYTLDWLADAVDLAGEFGLETVLGTPTAAAPAWMVSRYPEIVRLEPNGRPAEFGGRGHHNPANATYRHFCASVAGAMAERFGRHPRVIGWQIDNEYWPFSFDPDTQAQFQAYLRDQYGTLDSLNAAWSTAYWSQEYSEWSQIPLSLGWQNPCLITALLRFKTLVFRGYQQAQIEAIRPHADPRQWITHNLHGWFQHGDARGIASDLDFASWDPYVGAGHLDHVEMGMKGDLVRGFAKRNFWVMETQPLTVNWAGVNNPLDRGEMRTMAWHFAGHGADAVLYWQWRSASGGQEQYHGTILGQSGQPRPHYTEVQQVGREFAHASAALAGTTPCGQAALLWSFDDQWAVDAQKHHKDFSAATHAQAYYAPLRARGLDVDIVPPSAPLSQYPLVMAPHLYMLDDALVEHLLAYVAAGGCLLLGMRSGMKDQHNALLQAYPPGPRLSAALGAHVEEYYALEGDIRVTGALGEGTARTYAEWLSPIADDAEVLLRYQGHSWLDGQPAMVGRSHGAGRIAYLGAWLDNAAMTRVIDWALQAADLPQVALPEGMELCRRTGDGRDVVILINHTRDARTCRLDRTYADILRGGSCGPEVAVAALGVVVLEEREG